jgi:hypothetical protein
MIKNSALRKNLCKNNQLQKNEVVVRAADRSLSFLFQYKLNTAVCQAPDSKYPDATERSTVKSGYFAAHQFSLSGYITPMQSLFSQILLHMQPSAKFPIIL